MCVSKSWRDMISNSPALRLGSGLFYSTSSWYRTSEQIYGYVRLSGCCDSNCKEVIESWGASLSTSDVDLTSITYCNGLFLLYNERDVPAAYHVCNPATNQCVAVPDPPYPHVTPTYWPTSALAFDPHESPHYKIVRLVASSDNSAHVCIFSSKERRWIECNVHMEGAYKFSVFKVLDRYSVFMNGALHWIFNDSLFSFDVKKRCVRGVDLPKERLSGCPCIGKSEGHLFYACYGDSHVQIWMLQDFESGEWVLKHAICKESAEKHPFVIPFPSNPWAFHPDLEVLFIETKGKILSYHFGSKRNDNERLEEVCAIEIESYVNWAFPYSRCLSALDGYCN